MAHKQKTIILIDLKIKINILTICRKSEEFSYLKQKHYEVIEMELTYTIVYYQSEMLNS